MAQFVLVGNGVTNEAFEKAMEIKIHSKDKVKFVPQGSPNNQGGISVSSPAMASVKPSPNAQEHLNSVRFEWDQEGHEFGAEIVGALAGHHRRHEEQREPAA